MQQLNFPKFNFRFNSNGSQIFDNYRKKYVKCTPEEWVRQNILQFLVEYRNYPQNLIAVEKQLNINGLIRRYDAVIFNRDFTPIMIVECKAPSVELSEKVYEQICEYNNKLDLKFLLISNGLQHVAIEKNIVGNFVFLNDIPIYEYICK